SDDKTSTDSVQDQFGQIMNVQLLEDIAAVRLNGSDAQVQSRRHFPVALAGYQQLQNLFLAKRQQIVAVFDSPPVHLRDILFDENFRNRRTKVSLPGR